VVACALPDPRVIHAHDFDIWRRVVIRPHFPDFLPPMARCHRHKNIYRDSVAVMSVTIMDHFTLPSALHAALAGNPLTSGLKMGGVALDADKVEALAQRGDARAAAAHERVKDDAARRRD